MINRMETDVSDGANVVALVFLCRHKSGEPMPLDDTDAVVWMTYEKIQKICPPYVAKYIKSAMIFLRK